MKNKRAIIVTLLIVAILLLSIGYAAISKTLTVGGTVSANANTENFKVHFQGTTGTIESTKQGATLSATTDEDLSATINASGLDTAGQTVTATFTIVNDSTDLGATLAVNTKEITGDDAEYFEVTSATLGKTTLAAKTGDTADTTTLTVTLRLTKTPVEAVTGTVHVTVDATATEN